MAKVVDVLHGVSHATVLREEGAGLSGGQEKGRGAVDRWQVGSYDREEGFCEWACYVPQKGRAGMPTQEAGLSKKSGWSMSYLEQVHSLTPSLTLSKCRTWRCLSSCSQGRTACWLSEAARSAAALQWDVHGAGAGKWGVGRSPGAYVRRCEGVGMCAGGEGIGGTHLLHRQPPQLLHVQQAGREALGLVNADLRCEGGGRWPVAGYRLRDSRGCCYIVDDDLQAGFRGASR